MKTTISILLSCLLIASLTAAIGAQESQEKQQPSLEETLKWLSQKLKDDAGFTEGETREKIDEIEFEGCTVGCRWMHRESVSDVPFGIWLKLTFPLSTIDPDGIKVVFLKGHHHCAITSTKKFVRTSGNVFPSHESVSRSKNQKEILRAMSGLSSLLPGSDYEFRIPFEEKEIAERFAKAFAHAVRLCKAKKEPF